MISFIKKNILLSILLISSLIACQKKEFQEIDELFKAAEKSNLAYKDLETFKYSKKANILALKTGDSKIIAESYYKLALSLSSLELQKESLTYIQKAYTQESIENNILLQSKLKELKSYDYISLGLKSEGLQELFEARQIIEKRNDPESIKLLARIYGQIGNYYYYENNIDSAFVYYRLKSDQLKKIPEKDIFKNKAYLYNYIAKAFLKKKNADSSLYYIQKSFDLKQKYKDPLLFAEYISLGDYYSEQKNYQKALEFYLKSIQNMKEHSVLRTYSPDIYKKISEMYHMMGKETQYKEYEKIFSEKESKMLTERNKNTEYALNIILKDKADEYKKAQEKNYVYISIVILSLLIFFFFLYKLLNKDIKLKESLISEATSSLQNKEEIITQKDHETKQLQLKVNDSYQEVTYLAKNNDPSFYFRFQEVYPEFQKKILEINPNFRTTELILCAYTFLGFNIKDIADYTFKSVNTVRNRKQNLRKKFNLQTEEDMGIWLRNLIDPNP
ncbi:hypothetical protein A0O34_04625 [Chryseobacterium glaciei]|uniref:Uncharacterized protein n=1 Tax=Chryseobacterium glaciei TaxID=1685010 RepID=A0A172XSQ0_9FLAO|nr:tetratricopeptide repeat protein [Chryseobacterium glaciei]ANF49865.1 hypothetical protein A0O34_04625 [Chryseobacterium glaciei]